MEMRQQIARALIIAAVVMVCGFASMYEVSPSQGNAFADEPASSEASSSSSSSSGDASGESESSGESGDSQGSQGDSPESGGSAPSGESGSSEGSASSESSEGSESSGSSDPSGSSGASDLSEPSSSSGSSSDPSGSESSSSSSSASSGSASSEDPEETPLEKAKRLIEALPADPDDITESHSAAIAEAQAAYDALSAGDRATLDSTILGKEQSYGRWLEAAQWGLLAQRSLDSSIGIADGDYSAYVTSSSSMGKSTSQRSKTWTATKITVSNGQAWAVLQCDSVSAFRNMRVGGKNYTANVVDGVPEFEVPVKVNGTTTVTIDANSVADSIAVQVKVALPLNAASSDDVSKAKQKAQSIAKNASSKYVSADAAAIKKAADALSALTSKSGVTVIELAVAQKALDDTVTAAKALPKESSSSSSSSSKSSTSSTSSTSSSSGSSSSKSSAKSKSSSSAASSSSASSPKTVSGRGRSQSVPTVTQKKPTKTSSKSSGSSSKKDKSSSAASKSKASALKDPDDKSSEAPEKDKSALDEAAAAASGEQGMNQATGMPLLDSDSRKSPEFWMKLITASGVLTLLLLGMCLRTYLFTRAKEKA